MWDPWGNHQITSARLIHQGDELVPHLALICRYRCSTEDGGDSSRRFPVVLYGGS